MSNLSKSRLVKVLPLEENDSSVDSDLDLSPRRNVSSTSKLLSSPYRSSDSHENISGGVDKSKPNLNDRRRVNQQQPRKSMVAALTKFTKRRNSENIKYMLGMVAQKEFFHSTAWILCLLYNLVTIPYRVCFVTDYQYAGNAAFTTLDAMANLFFTYHLVFTVYWFKPPASSLWEEGAARIEVIDEHRSALMRSVLAFKRRGARYVAMEGRSTHRRIYRDVKDVMRKLFTGKLLNERIVRLGVEALAILPLNMFAAAAGAPTLAPWLLNRLLHIFFVGNETSKILRFLEDSGRMTNVMVQRFWLLFMLTFLAGHYAACFFFLLSSNQCAAGHECWAHYDGLVDSSGSLVVSPIDAYNRSFYWAVVTMTTVGFGDIVPISVAETWFTVGTMYVGIFVVTAPAIANLTLLMTTVDRARNEFQLKMDATNKYMTYRRIPPWLRARITSFFNYRWKLLKGIDEQQFLESLPHTLRQKVTNSMAHKLLRKLPILKSAPPSLINALVTELESYIYSPGDDIIGLGDPLLGVLLLSQGELELVSEKGIMERTLSSGEYFGSESLLGSRRGEVGAIHECPSIVRAKTFVEVYVLPAQSFASVCQHYEGAIDQSATSVYFSRALHKRNFKAQKIIGSGGGNATDNIVENLRGFSRLCVPGSLFRQCWDASLSAALLFYSISLPLHLSRILDDMTFMQQAGLLIVGYMADILYLVDIVLQGRYFFRQEAGLLVMDPSTIWMGFASSRNVVLEGIVSLPIDILGVWLGARWLSALRLIKIPRLMHFGEYMGRIQSAMQAQRIAIGIHLRRFLGLNLAMIIACHWVGCIWFLAASISDTAGAEENWVLADRENPSTFFHPSLHGYQAEAYLRSYYFAMVSMSTVGYGDIAPRNSLETVVASIIVLIGGMLLPAVVGGLAALISSIQQASKEFRTKVGELAAFMDSKRYPYGLRERILHYYDYIWSRQGGVQEEQILDELPAPLRRKVAMVVNGRTLRNIPFLNTGESIGRAHEFIVAVLVPRTFLPGDLIVKAGEMGKDMFMIEKGSVHVKPADLGITLAALNQGDYFGETALLLSTKCLASVVAVSYCDTFALSKNDFHAVTCAHPEWRETILTELMSLVTVKAQCYSSVTRNLTRCVKLRGHLGGVGSGGDNEKQGISSSSTIHPEASVREIWAFVVFSVIIANVIFIPFALAFLPQVEFYIPLWILDPLLWVDIYLKAYYFAVVKEGQLVTESGEIMALYRENGMALDVISSMPWDILCLALLGQSAYAIRLALAVCRLPKVMRAPQLQSLSTVFDRTARRFGIRLVPVQLLRLLCGVLLIAHWASLGLYMIARYQSCELDDTCDWDETWIVYQIEAGKLPEDGGSVVSRYVRSFNWAMPTLVVVVIGDVIPVNVSETLYALGWMLLGMTVNATIIGNVANLVANLESQEAEFINTADALKHYLDRIEIPDSLRSRIDDYLVEIWMRYKGMVGRVQSNVDELPVTLRSNVCQLFMSHHIKRCHFFSDLSEETINNLSQHMRTEVYGKGDIIIQAGETGSEMFWVDAGSVSILSADGMSVYATLPSGSFFGETAMFFSSERSATVVAAEFCELLRLDRDSILEEISIDKGQTKILGSRFEQLKNANAARNQNVGANLDLSEVPTSKLNKIVHRRAQEKGRLQRYGVLLKLFRWGGKIRLLWEAIAVTGLMYYAVEIPYRIAFVPTHDALAFIVPSYLYDFFFILDFLGRYFMLPDFSGKSQRAEGMSIHSREAFVADALATFPWDIVALGGDGAQWLPFCRLPHLIRLVNTSRHISAVQDHITAIYRLRLSVSIQLLIKVFVIYVLIAHWWACVWFMIHRYAERDNEMTWAIDDGLAEYDSGSGKHNMCSVRIGQCYARSFYFALTTLSTTGFGDISPTTNFETVWEWVVVLTGACLLAGTIGAFTALFQHIDTSGDSYFKANMVTVNQYMRQRDLPSDLQNAIRLHLHQIWTKNRVLDMEPLLQMLSVPLRMEIMAIKTTYIFLICPALQELESLMQKRLSLALTEQICQGGSSVYEAGEAGTNIFFVRKGIVDVKPPTGADVASAGADPAAVALCRAKFHRMGVAHYEGNYFGEWCLLLPSNMRIDTANARTNSELYSIDRQALHEVIHYMPSSKRSLFVRRLITSNGTKMHTKVCLVTEGDGSCWKAEVLCTGLEGGKAGIVRSAGMHTAVQRASLILQPPASGGHTSTRRSLKRHSMHREHVLAEVKRLSIQAGFDRNSAQYAVSAATDETCAVMPEESITIS